MTRETSNWAYGMATHPGTVKEINEDNAILKIVKDSNGTELMLVMIADGMGGYQAGDVASRTVIEKVNHWWEAGITKILESQQPFETIEYQLTSLLDETNTQLIAYGKSEGKRLGTTATLLFLYHGYFLIVHIGDSRVYQLEEIIKEEGFTTERIYSNEAETAALLERRKIRQLTEDHSWVESQVKLGVLTKEQATTHENKNILLQCLGIESGINPFVNKGTYRPDDLFLLCSDGFYNLFTDQEILALLANDGKEEMTLQHLSNELVARANDAGATDNVTVLLSKALSMSVQPSWTRKMRRFFHKIM